LIIGHGLLIAWKTGFVRETGKFGHGSHVQPGCSIRLNTSLGSKLDCKIASRTITSATIETSGQIHNFVRRFSPGAG
jgi:hypothetical protein